MIKCLIIDDEAIGQDLLLSKLTRIPFVEIVGVFDSAVTALEALNNTRVDLVFCDINMPDLSGVSLYKSLANPPLFVFVTGNPEFAVEGYELNILDYIVKPYSTERLLKALSKAQAFLSQSSSRSAEQRDNLIIKDRSHVVILPYNEVFFIKGDKDYVLIDTLEKRYNIWRKLMDMEDVLKPAPQFLRVHKSYIVNLDFAKRVEGNIIKMKGSIEDIPIGGQYRSELFRKLGFLSQD